MFADPAYRHPLLYNLSVSREILRQIYIAERLQPPTSFAAITDAYTTLWSRAMSPAYWRQMASNGELLKVGIYVIEAYGIFKVGLLLSHSNRAHSGSVQIGEMIGRRHLVGYKLD
jgi:F-type H+-transporting ATPase subunit g